MTNEQGTVRCDSPAFKADTLLCSVSVQYGSTQPCVMQELLFELTGLGELLQSNESKQHDSRVGLRALGNQTDKNKDKKTEVI